MYIGSNGWGTLSAAADPNLLDDFNDAAIDALWTNPSYLAGTSVVAVETSGQLQMGNASLTSGDERAMATDATANFTNKFAYFNISNYPTNAVVGYIGFQKTDFSKKVEFWIDNNSLKTAYNNTVSVTVGAPGANHAWLKIENDGTNWVWSTAPDSSGSPGSWTQQDSVAEATIGAGTALNISIGLVAQESAACSGFNINSVYTDGM